jgi:hypothetical protein
MKPRMHRIDFEAVQAWCHAACEVDLVEPVGIEPTTPCLQSRCSPS